MPQTRRRVSMPARGCAASIMSACRCRTLTHTASARSTLRARTRRAQSRRGWTRAGAWVKRSAHCFKCCGIGSMMQRAAVSGTRITSSRMLIFCSSLTPQTMRRASMMRRAATFCASSATCSRTGCTRSCGTAAAVLRSVAATTDATPRSGEVCLPTGECREPIVEVEHRGSQTDHRVEIGFASPGCAASPATSGASPWERARHLTAQHGLCGHRHSVTYERMMLALGDRNNSRQACTLRSAGGFDYYECDRNHTEWDWVTENPAWWGRRGGPRPRQGAERVRFCRV